jgi:hypothetical protein
VAQKNGASQEELKQLKDKKDALDAEHAKELKKAQEAEAARGNTTMLPESNNPAAKSQPKTISPEDLDLGQVKLLTEVIRALAVYIQLVVLLETKKFTSDEQAQIQTAIDTCTFQLMTKISLLTYQDNERRAYHDAVREELLQPFKMAIVRIFKIPGFLIPQVLRDKNMVAQFQKRVRESVIRLVKFPLTVKAYRRRLLNVVDAEADRVEAQNRQLLAYHTSIHSLHFHLMNPFHPTSNIPMATITYQKFDHHYHLEIHQD